MNTKRMQLIHKSLYGIALAGLIISLCLGNTGAASANSNEAPTATPPPTQPTPPSLPYPSINAHLNKIPAQAKAAASPQSIALGAPGLSFRYVQTYGVTDQAYLPDAQHLNAPNGLFIDGNNNLYVAEELGSKMDKYRISDGANLLNIGTAGMRYTDNYVFSWLEDEALDGSGNIWVADGSARVVEYDPAGNFLQELPPGDPWNQGNDDTHFGDPTGIAFDSTGRMFVSDRSNHRIQVYDFVSGSPVYSATIGETGVPGTDDAHFDMPNHIAVDSSDRLYVPDMNNNRVQRCSFAVGWTCTTFDGTGSAGNASNELDQPTGIGIDSGDNVFIADYGNKRIKKCTSAGSCTVFATGPDKMHDVAVDSSGNVYASDWTDSTIRKYNSSGVFQGIFAGTSGVPYVADTTRLNSPEGISVTGDGSLFITEDRGVRLVKLNAAGTQQWTFGQAGVPGSDNTLFGGGFPGLVGNPAIDSAGRIYVSDTNNNRVQIFNSNGAYAATFGSPGAGNGQFECPTGVTISPVNGDIYVTDRCNNRIQVFGSSRVYKTQLGDGNYGSSNTEFGNPWGVAVDLNGNIYVADTDNSRIQKCTLNGTLYNCSLFAGVTGESGSDFGHLSGPFAVAVDGAGRVYVADRYNNRVQVFDSAGAYLTTIGGAWGANTGEMRNPAGVALDTQGNLYVTDYDNHRIQKFAPGVPGWKQDNLNGFGYPSNTFLTTLEVFNGQLYAGASNWNDGATIWRSSDAHTWTQITQPGLESTYTGDNAGIPDMAVFNGQLYASAGWGNGTGQLFRTTNGTTWNQVVGDGFGDGANNALEAMVVYNGMLYVGTNNQTSGPQIWRSSSGDASSWINVVPSGLGCGGCVGITSLMEFKGFLYAAVEALNNPATGIQIWRSATGASGDWSQVGTSGFGTTDNYQTGGFAIFNGMLYIGTRNDGSGGQLWRSSNGSNWMQVVGDGFGDINNMKVESLYTFGGSLYAGTDNSTTGVEIWSSPDGITWNQINPDGFGSSSNFATLWSSAVTSFNGNLLYDTANNDSGGEVWQLLNKIFLPLIKR